MSGKKNSNNLKLYDWLTTVSILCENEIFSFFPNRTTAIGTSQKVILFVVPSKINNKYKFTEITLGDSRNNMKITQKFLVEMQRRNPEYKCLLEVLKYGNGD